MNKKFYWVKIITCIIAVIAVVLSVLVFLRVNKTETYSTINPTFVPAGRFGGIWPYPDDQSKCKDAFSKITSPCQADPSSDKVGCSDYPYYYCDGQLHSGGTLNNECSYGAAVAYSSAECDQPRKSMMNGGYLCGGTLDSCVDKEKTGMSCLEEAPPNPWGATNVCFP